MAERGKIIWVLFGDTHGLEVDVVKLREVYKAREQAVEKKGYFIAMPKGGTTKADFLKLVADPATWAVVWHSHGADGVIAGSEGKIIKPSDIKSRSPKLQFAALHGCETSTLQSEWIKAFGLNRFKDAQKRLAGEGSKTPLWTMSIGSKTVDAPPRKFAEAYFQNRFLPYNFETWISELP